MSEIWSKMFICLHVKYQLILARYQWNMNILDILFWRYSYIKSRDNPTSGSRIIPCGRTDRRIARYDEANLYVLLTMHLSISVDNGQLDAHMLYFTIRSLQSSTCFEHYMLIIRRLNCIDAASCIVLSVSGRPVRRLREFSLNLCTGWPLTERMIPNAASIQFGLLMMSM